MPSYVSRHTQSSTGRGRRRLMAVVVAVVTAFAACASAPLVARAASRPEPGAIRALITRVLGPAAAAQLHVTVTGDPGADSFTVSGDPADIAISGNTKSAALTGVGWYLKYVAHADVNLGNLHPRVPASLPAPSAPIHQTAGTANRFVFNDTNDGYTDPNMGWSEWQARIDMLALHGINEVYVTPGAEAVYEQLFEKYGYTAEQLRNWIPQPAHQPWWLLQNMSLSGQPAMPQSQIDARAQLGRQITDRLRDLGMVPVLPGFFGTVPADFASHQPGATVVQQGSWVGYQRPGWLDPTTPLFASLAADYYRISDQVLGASTMYKMDPLHEGGTAGSVNVPAAAGAIESSLQAAHPGATWVILGWQSNPSAAVRSGIKDPSHLLIVDGLSDRYSSWNRDADWPGFPYTFGSIYDFGGHTTIGANMQVWLDRYYAAAARSGGHLSGIAIMPEGFDNNPAAWELLAEMPWHAGEFDLATWLKDYALGRYGTEAAAAAWQTLAVTAYSEPADGWSEPADNLFAAQPSLTVTTAATWSPGAIRYDAAEFEKALPQLLAAGPKVPQQQAFDYDLTDVTRQVIDNRARVLLPQIAKAYQAKDRARFETLTSDWESMTTLLDQVAGTNTGFMLGTYLEHAKAAATTPDEATALQQDLQSLITVWGTKSGFQSGLADYANRDWQGLISTYYAPRWKMYFDSLDEALRTGTTPKPIDWWAYGEDWAQTLHSLPTKPTGDIQTVARHAEQVLAADPNMAGIKATSSAQSVSSDSPITVTATVTNSNGLAGFDAGTAALVVPAGLTATPDGSTAVGTLQPGASKTVSWTVSVSDPSALTGVLAVLRATAGTAEHPLATSVSVLSGSAPSAPWHVFKSTNATLVQAGSQLGVSASGADMWGSTLQYGDIYQQGVIKDGSSVTVRVASQVSQGGRPWARSGILIGSDLSTAASAGMVNLAITPSNGCVLSWDSTGTKRLSTYVNAPAAAPVWLRLTRVGPSYRAQCSADGTTWTTVGTATPVGVTATADAGLFSSAANSGGSDQVVATFDDFSVS